MEDSNSLQCVSSSSSSSKNHENELRISTSSTEYQENKNNSEDKVKPKVESSGSMQKAKTDIISIDIDQMKSANELSEVKQDTSVLLASDSEKICEPLDHVQKGGTPRFKRQKVCPQPIPVNDLDSANKQSLMSSTKIQKTEQWPKFQLKASSSQPICANDFAFQKPKNWYIEYKKQVALVKKWQLRSIRAEEKLSQVSAHLNMASGILK